MGKRKLGAGSQTVEQEPTYQVVVTVATREQANVIVSQLGLAEEEGDIDFPFNTEIKED